MKCRGHLRVTLLSPDTPTYHSLRYTYTRVISYPITIYYDPILIYLLIQIISYSHISWSQIPTKSLTLNSKSDTNETAVHFFRSILQPVFFFLRLATTKDWHIEMTYESIQLNQTTKCSEPSIERYLFWNRDILHVHKLYTLKIETIALSDLQFAFVWK